MNTPEAKTGLLIGAVALQGPAKDLRDNALIIRSYLGLAKASPVKPAIQKEIA